MHLARYMLGLGVVALGGWIWSVSGPLLAADPALSATQLGTQAAPAAATLAAPAATAPAVPTPEQAKIETGRYLAIVGNCTS